MRVGGAVVSRPARWSSSPALTRARGSRVRSPGSRWRAPTNTGEGSGVLTDVDVSERVSRSGGPSPPYPNEPGSVLHAANGPRPGRDRRVRVDDRRMPESSSHRRTFVPGRPAATRPVRTPLADVSLSYRRRCRVRTPHRGERPSRRSSDSATPDLLGACAGLSERRDRRGRPSPLAENPAFTSSRGRNNRNNVGRLSVSGDCGQSRRPRAVPMSRVPARGLRV
jgi:hypothetical protein